MIAIVGMACQYADATTPRELWENVLARRRSFRRFPGERLNLDDYFSNDRDAADAIYVSEGAFIEGYEFDRVKFRIAGPTYRNADLTHWLALDVAARAIADAGLIETGLPAESTGVIVGNTLTGEFSRASLMRLRWPYVRRMLDSQLNLEGWDASKRGLFLAALEEHYKAPFEPVGEETLAGGLSNTIAGRICNYFNLRGGGYTVDGACSSSLLAVSQACQSLQNGEMDAALVGGVDLSLDPFELIGFSKIGALASGEMRVFDRDSSGFLPGEGCGFLLLMRHEDALERGLRCYALVRGWGISSDGGGGITRPEFSGQRLAFERAYRKAGYGPGSVALFECHGTGTQVGDEVELSTLAFLLEGASHPSYIGSVKANIGHTKAAAGVAGLLKATMALHTQILPPATGIHKPHHLLQKGPIGYLQEGRCWPEGQPLRAGVSSFGFGGINVHIALENPQMASRRKFTPREAELLSSYQDFELFLFAAEDRQSLIALVESVTQHARDLSYAELASLAAWLAVNQKGNAARAAVVASSPKALAERLFRLRDWLNEDACSRIDVESGIFLSCGKKMPRICLLFPGQASPVRFNGGAMGQRFAAVRELYLRVRLDEGDPIATAIAQPAIVAAELAGLSLLDALDIKADLALGHSLGELSALYWSGAMDEEALFRIVRERGQAMTELPQGEGAMASIAADEFTVSALIEGEPGVAIAGLNSPRQTVVSGESRSVAKIIARAEQQGLPATLLPVSHGFHSPLMKPAAEHLGAFLSHESLSALQGRVISTVSGKELPGDADIAALLESQLTAKVRFTEALEAALPESDLFLEVGPGNVIAGLVAAKSDVPMISLDCGGHSLLGLLKAAGAAFAAGSPLNRQALFDGRICRPYEPGHKYRFFMNPCEQAPRSESPPPLPLLKPHQEAPSAEKSDALSTIRQLVANRAELPISSVQDHHHLLRDLHLNSISIGQVIAEASRQLNLPPPLAPTEFANATVEEAAFALEQLQGDAFVGVSQEKNAIPAGLDAWVLPFAVEKKPTPLPSRHPGKPAPSFENWRLYAPSNHPSADCLLAGLKALGGEGILVCLPPSKEEGHDAMLLEAAHASLERDGQSRKFIVVQQSGIAGSFVRTLFLESRRLDACVVDVADLENCMDRVVREAEAASGFDEVFYDAEGGRWSPVLRPLHIQQQQSEALLSADDVLLVSGGGKGIAAESALHLARETGVRLLLLGRASPDEDAELAANLERFQSAGVVFLYCRADVADCEKVKAAIAVGQDGMGPVTAILHGAGINQPRALARLDMPGLEATLRPKTLGLANLLGAVDASKLRLLVAFGSVIGRIGLHGEADYALANARLSRMVEDFQTSHPHCRCLSLEWSIWSGAGMGERLGRVEALLSEGITPITPDQGLDWLRRLIAAPVPSPSLLVCGRIGAKPPMRMVGDRELPFLRFLEHPRVYYPGVELVVEAELSQVSDPYLDDHVFQGELLLPAVLGLEAMAQVARALALENGVPDFEAVELARPVVVDSGKSLTLRLAALIRQPGRIEVALRCSQTAFQVDHFRAVCLYGHDENRQAEPNPPGSEAGYIPLSPGQDLYGKLLFHTGRFQRLLGYRSLGAFHCQAEIGVGNPASWFGRYLPQELVLGDPGSRDTAIHALQACIPHATILPVGLDRLISHDVHVPGPWSVHARELWQDKDLFCYDLEIRGNNGILREKWKGLRLRRVANPPRQPWVESLLMAYLERRLRELLPASRVAITLVDGAEMERLQRAELSMQRLLGKEAVIARRTDGKPETEGPGAVAVAHSGELTLAVAGEAPLSCDLERIIARHPSIWHDLLGRERYPLAELISRQSGESFEVSATRVWAAIECLKKAGLPPNVPLTLLAEEEDGWVMLGAGKSTVATYCAELEMFPPPRLLAVLV